jgi:hypothetical protein
MTDGRTPIYSEYYLDRKPYSTPNEFTVVSTVVSAVCKFYAQSNWQLTRALELSSPRTNGRTNKLVVLVIIVRSLPVVSLATVEASETR